MKFDPQGLQNGTQVEKDTSKGDQNGLHLRVSVCKSGFFQEPPGKVGGMRRSLEIYLTEFRAPYIEGKESMGLYESIGPYTAKRIENERVPIGLI